MVAEWSGSEKEMSEVEEQWAKEIERWSEERELLPLCLLPPFST